MHRLKSEEVEKIYTMQMQTKKKTKKAGVAILISDKTDFRTKL